MALGVIEHGSDTATFVKEIASVVRTNTRPGPACRSRETSPISRLLEECHRNVGDDKEVETAFAASIGLCRFDYRREGVDSSGVAANSGEATLVGLGCRMHRALLLWGVQQKVCCSGTVDPPST